MASGSPLEQTIVDIEDMLNETLGYLDSFPPGSAEHTQLMENFIDDLADRLDVAPTRKRMKRQCTLDRTTGQVIQPPH